MPAKKEQISDAERAKRLEETARKTGTGDDSNGFERAFKKVISKARIKTPESS